MYIASKMKDDRALSICEVEASLGQYRFKKVEINEMEEEILRELRGNSNI